ncbi:ABC transporter permease [Microbacterium koreense]|uniref:ABC transporter permease n=1 Tax=Microbacterium koreense TaxID=323761 RepID=A0ABW2ZRC1_9MICO
MYGTYLRRELAGRKKQTIIVAAGLAIAIALVMVVTALTAGVRDAQAQALESVYGVGTDLTVTGAQTQPGDGGGGGPRFEFDESGADISEDGTAALAQSRLMSEPGRATLDASTVESVRAVTDVADAAGTLALTNTSFSGELPEAPADGSTEQPAQGQPGGGGAGGGFGGGSFDIASMSVLGVDPASTEVGPMTAVAVDDGRALAATDAGSNVAVVDATYAAANELSLGDAVDLGGEQFEIVGIVSSTSSEADTAADVFIPLDVAQALSGVGDVVSTVYVRAASAEAITTIQAAIEEAVPDAVVSSQSDLAAGVSSSLGTATSLITNLGTWLSIIVLAVALGLAILFTTSGVARRTREIGTLKAIGWSNRRIVAQVSGESLVQGLIGGAAGLALGLIAIAAVNLAAPTISAAAESSAGRPEGGPGGAGGGGGFFANATSSATEIVLQAPVTPWVLGTAVGLAVVGGLIAGAFGGWRAARLSPAEALRTVA